MEKQRNPSAITALNLARVQGFEPRLKASKASVLPLDDTLNFALV